MTNLLTTWIWFGPEGLLFRGSGGAAAGVTVIVGTVTDTPPWYELSQRQGARGQGTLVRNHGLLRLPGQRWAGGAAHPVGLESVQVPRFCGRTTSMGSRGRPPSSPLPQMASVIRELSHFSSSGSYQQNCHSTLTQDHGLNVCGPQIPVLESLPQGQQCQEVGPPGGGGVLGGASYWDWCPIGETLPGSSLLSPM